MQIGTSHAAPGYTTIGSVWPIFFASLIFITLIFFLIGFFIWHKTTRNTSIRSFSLSLVVLLFLSFSWADGYLMEVFLTPQDYYLTLFPAKKVPAKLKILTDQFVINQIGKEEFEKNYKLDYQKTENCSSQSLGCLVYYEFTPGKPYGGMWYRLYFSDYDEPVKMADSQIIPTFLSCTRDANKCDFRISLDSVQALAVREQLTDMTFVVYNDTIAIQLSRCRGYHPRRVLINPLTGQKMADEPIPGCIDIS